MLEEGIDTTTFLHKSVLEYYAAAFIKHSTDEVARLFYQVADQNYRTWQEVIRFLADIDPYRYSKEFAVDQLAKIRSEFIEPLKDRKDSMLLRTILSIHPSFGVYYRSEGNDNDQFGLASFGPFSARPRLMYEALDDLLISASEDTLPSDVTLSELENILERKLENSELGDEIEVPLHRVIAFGGSTEFWQAVDIFSSRIEQMELEVQTTIARQEKRKLIFQGKRPKNA